MLTCLRNAAMMLKFLMDIASLDVLPTTKFYDYYLHVSESDPINDNFNALGFGSMSFMYNMGSLLVACLFVPVIMLLTLLMRYG